MFLRRMLPSHTHPTGHFRSLLLSTQVGFLASQLPHALPVPAAPSSSGIGGGASGDALLLVGWWVPEQ